MQSSQLLLYGTLVITAVTGRTSRLNAALRLVDMLMGELCEMKPPENLCMSYTLGSVQAPYMHSTESSQ